MVPKMPMSSTPAPGTLYGKRDSEDVTNLRIGGGGAGRRRSGINKQTPYTVPIKGDRRVRVTDRR